MLVITTSIEVNGGGRRIRTFETFVAELQSAPFDRSGIPPITLTFSVEPLLLHYKTLDGAGTRIRTVDLLITSQLLYQLSYAGVSFVSYLSYRNGVQFSKKKNPCKCFFKKNR